MTFSKIGQPLRETADWSDVHSWQGISSMDSADIWHRLQRDPGIASESLTQCRMTVSQLTGEDGFNVMVRDSYKRLVGRYAGEESVTWRESPVFPTLRSAQLFAEWALERWHAEGSFSHAGFEARYDLDAQGNPYS
tara:strand:+ start:4133 stop:4540 length:408 start_codon:yes stop_codon:yes gene_type:complete